jgi:peptide/nickel transport system ATP-binding protein
MPKAVSVPWRRRHLSIPCWPRLRLPVWPKPMTSLSPAFTIGDQLIEGIRCHSQLGHPEARQHAIDMLRRVRIPSPERRIDEYPHKLSGGMRQRVMIAMALSSQRPAGAAC